MANILCFGDSITFGYSDPEGGWTQRLSKALGNIYVNKSGNYMHSVYNLGVDGDDSKGLLKRIKTEIEARSYNDLVIVMFIGVNDSIYFRDKGNICEIEDFEENLSKIIKIARGFSKNIILLGTTPVDEAKTQPVQDAMEDDVCYSNARLRQFNDSIKKIAEIDSVHFEDIFENMRKLEFESYFFSDGSHPNSAGHQYIADRIKKRVAEMANGYDEQSP